MRNKTKENVIETNENKKKVITHGKSSELKKEEKKENSAQMQKGRMSTRKQNVSTVKKVIRRHVEKRKYEEE